MDSSDSESKTESEERWSAEELPLSSDCVGNLLVPAEEGYYSFSAAGSFGTELSFITWEGEKKPLEEYQPLPEAENPDGWQNFSSVSGVAGSAVTEDGNLCTIEYIRSSGEWDTTGMTAEQVKLLESPYRNEEYLRLLDGETGKELKCAKLEKEDSLLLEESSLLAVHGKRYVLCQNEMGNGIAILNESGAVESIALYGGYCSQLLRLADGSVAVIAQNTAGSRVLSVLQENSQFKDIFELPADAAYITSAEAGEDFFYTESETCFLFHSESNSTERLFSWTLAGINPSHVLLGPTMGEDGCVRVLVSEGDCFTLFSFCRKDVSPEAETEAGTAPQRLTLVTLSPDNVLLDAVASFNRSSSGCKIEITDLSSSLRENETAEEALLRYLQNQSEAGFPDLLDLSGFSLSALASQGLLENLYPYLDADTELDRADFFENMLALLETDGKLCSTGAVFRIHTVLGPSSVVGDTAGWSYEEYEAALTSVQPGRDAFDSYTTSGGILSACLCVQLNEISEAAGAGNSGNRNSENTVLSGGEAYDELASLLRFAVSFPAEDPTIGRSWTDETDTTDLRIHGGKQLLLSDTVYDFSSFLRCGYMYSEEVTCVGYPCENGTGNAAEISSLSDGKNFAILAQSEHKDAAWQWLRRFFTKEYAETLSEFPLRKDVFEERLADAKTVVYRTDDSGKTILDAKTGEPVEQERETMYLSNWVSVPIYSMTDDQEQKLHNFVESTTKLYTPADALVAELCAEAEPYFEGTASLEETTARMLAAIKNQ